MGKVGRKGRRWFGLLGTAGVLFVGVATLAVGAMGACSLVTEDYPGWAGTGVQCHSNAECADDNPCTESFCDEHGVCKTHNVDGEGPSDMLPCTKDLCEGGAVSHPPDVAAPCGYSGKAHCNANGECSGCAPATADEDCGGPEYWCDAVVCRFKRGAGELCPEGAACLSGICVDGSCCEGACNGTCRSCNADLTDGSPGVCAPVIDGLDPHAECPGFACDGQGGCLGALGSPCTQPTNCTSGHCDDGVCCNDACNGTCRTCALEGQIGMCLFIPSGQDPDDECVLSTTCSGFGTCVLGSNGEACTSPFECETTNCVDGVCCNTGCGALCASCALAGSVGVCANIPAGTDPANECAGAMTCDGAGACL